jgi:hypothetical protein
LFKEEEFDEAEPAGVDPVDADPVDEEPAGVGESPGVVGTFWAINNDPLRTTTTNQNCLFMNRPAEYNRLVIGCRIAIPGFPYSTLAETLSGGESDDTWNAGSTGASRVVTGLRPFQSATKPRFQTTNVENAGLP